MAEWEEVGDAPRVTVGGSAIVEAVVDEETWIKRVER
jgi:hypothetical protein